MAGQTFYFNGIDGTTGQYLLPPQSADDVAEAARNDRGAADRVADLAAARPESATRGLPWGTDERVVAQAGWGIVFHADEPPDVRAALGELVRHRERTVPNAKLRKELVYQPGETAAEWLQRYGTRPGDVRPAKVPLYLLVVGSPERIPLQFTQDLDAEYAVGRLHFDTAEEYARYAAGVVAYELAASVPNTRDAVFFGTRHAFDRATQLSADGLLTPLATGPVDDEGQTIAARAGFTATVVVGDAAERAVLLDLLRGQGPDGRSPLRPSLLFTATHGVGFPLGHERQPAWQGALLCQDWPALGRITPDDYVGAGDVPDDARLSGLVAVLFGCYSAGTPRWDRFWRGKTEAPPQIAPAPFFAALPRRLLAHPGGGALACIGHVERAWGSSLADAESGAQIQAWQTLVSSILAGETVGVALKGVNDRYAMRSVELASLLDAGESGAGESGAGGPGDGAPSADALAAVWLDRNDAGGFVLLGDPAVRLNLDALS